MNIAYPLPAAGLAALALTACGSGGSSDPTPPAPLTDKEAARLLNQATLGASPRAMAEVKQLGIAGWLAQQTALPATPAHLDYVRTRISDPAGTRQNSNTVIAESFWKQAVEAPDMLRQRVAFALSQIFVISLEGEPAAYPLGVADYMDMLGRQAFGNFRELLEAVSLHPMMGIYLSHLRNRKADPRKNTVPDENFAREIMQLFSIGLYELHEDGSLKQANGAPIETYTNADISGLAKVFTGWSWVAEDLSDTSFWGWNDTRDADWPIKPMIPYVQFHATEEKSFLGLTIAAQSSLDPKPRDSLKAALDHLFQHANVGPFIGKQLIQRLVCSNPSPAYVARVARVFANNGQGVRGDLRAVVQAILLDEEARSASLDAGAGRVREPLLRLTHWMRAFGAQSRSGNYTAHWVSDPTWGLAQNPMRSPSVFNFYRPGYVVPGGITTSHGHVAPELQITSEVSVAGYIDFISYVIDKGVGLETTVDGIKVRDISSDYTAEIALADTPDALLDHLGLLLNDGYIPDSLRQNLIPAVSAISISATDSTLAAKARLNRVKLAIFLLMASPAYLVQH